MKEFLEYFKEDGGTVAVNNVGGGNIAGAGVNNPNITNPPQGEPPVRKRQKNKYQEANKKEEVATTKLVFGMVKRA